MKKLSKAERHELYKKALIFSRKKYNEGGTWASQGLCIVLLYTHVPNYDDQYYYVFTVDYFPEFGLFMPYTSTTNEIREIILLFCIEMTK